MLYQGIIGGGSSPVEPVDLSPVLLWTNSNIGAQFTAQTVNLDLAEYAGVIVEFNRSASSDAQTFANRSFIKKGETGLGGGNTVAVTPASRNVSCSNTGVTFEGGYSGTNPNDNAIIPTKIYGVKEYVVETVETNIFGENVIATEVASIAEKHENNATFTFTFNFKPKFIYFTTSDTGGSVNKYNVDNDTVTTIYGNEDSTKLTKTNDFTYSYETHHTTGYIDVVIAYK